MRRLLNHDPLTGITEWFIPDDEGRKFIIHTQQDVTKIVEENKKNYNFFDEKAPWKGEWHRVASIPLHIWYDLKKKGITRSEVELKKWLNDPEHKYFRTRPGRV